MAVFQFVLLFNIHFCILWLTKNWKKNISLKLKAKQQNPTIVSPPWNVKQIKCHVILFKVWTEICAIYVWQKGEKEAAVYKNWASVNSESLC